jgi:hypothetical protein
MNDYKHKVFISQNKSYEKIIVEVTRLQVKRVQTTIRHGLLELEAVGADRSWWGRSAQWRGACRSEFDRETWIRL